MSETTVVSPWLIAELSIWSFGLPPPVGLALVVLIGYFVTWHQRVRREAVSNSRHDINRIRGILRELESISRGLRLRVTRHHSDILKFKTRIDDLANQPNGLVGLEVCDEASRLLRSIVPLASEVAQTYYDIRRQTNMLMQISETRIDSLTGVGNRHALDDDLAAMLARFALNDRTFAIAMFDIDHFKRINDERGHLQGDRILQQVAQHLAKHVGKTDIVTRYGGEEFVVMMPEADSASALLCADGLRLSIQAHLGVTVSCGVAEAKSGDDVVTILTRADEALYAAKQGGRNRVCVHAGGGVESR
ncbi:MAG: GGDEF domain-containing protein [Pirellulales bacterium]